MTLEINTTRGLAAQILRHRSFTFQEFSQRYADTNLLTQEIPVPELRRQDIKNRQNSIDDLNPELVAAFNQRIKMLFAEAQELYDDMLSASIAKESARFVLPLAVPTRIYMSGSVRSWVHYIELREKNGTQQEHMEIAVMCKQIFSTQFPIVAEALEWN
jgi:thymidylate synthase (FAD)